MLVVLLHVLAPQAMQQPALGCAQALFALMLIAEEAEIPLSCCILWRKCWLCSSLPSGVPKL